MKHYGIDIQRQKAEETDQDWRFGAFSKPGLADIPHDARQKYLPVGEIQFGKEDFMDCSPRADLNSLEAQFTWLIDEI